MLWKNILFFIILSMLSACSSKPTNVPVKLKIVKGLSAIAATYGGGVVVVGRSLDGLESFRFGLSSTTAEFSLDLKKGKWEFAAISWSGENGFFTGTTRCSDSSVVDLVDAEAIVNFNLSQARCLSPYSSSALSFTTSSFQDASGNFFSFQPLPCVNASLNLTNCPAGSNVTIYKSYNVQMPPEKKGTLTASLPGLNSECRMITETATLKLPMGKSTETSPFGMFVNLYPSENCSGAPLTQNFSSGISRSIAGDSLRALDFNPALMTSYLLINTGAASVLANNVLINSNAIYTNNTSVSVSFETPQADVTDICFRTTNSSTGCTWLAMPQSSPQPTTLSAAQGTQTIYMFTRNALSAVNMVGQDSIIVDTVLPAYTTGGSYASAYNSSSFPLNLSWGAFTDTTPVTYTVSYCPTVGCNSGCTYLISSLTNNNYSADAPGADGNIFVCVAGTDAAGNVSISTSTGNFVYDNSAPSSASIVLNSGAALTNSNLINYNASAIGATWKCFSESANSTGCIWAAYNAIAGTIATSLSEGTKTVFAHFKDDAGNITSISDTIVLDTSAPTLPGAGSLPAYVSLSSYPFAVSWIDSMDVHLSSYDFKICQTNDCSTSCGTPRSTPGVTASATLTLSDGMTEGLNYLCVRAVDSAANVSAYSAVASYTHDTTAPDVTSANFQINGGAQFTNTSTVTWTVTGVTGTPNEQCISNSPSSGSCAWVGLSSSGSHTLATANANNTLYLFYRDLAGNVSAYKSASIIHDSIVPSQVTINSPNVVSEIEGNMVQVNFTASSDTNLSGYLVKLCDNSSCSGTFYDSQSLPAGQTTANLVASTPWPLNTQAYVAIIAKDSANNYSSPAVSPAITNVIYTRVKDVVADYNHTCALLSDGKVKCWGVNAAGQLGSGSVTAPVGDTIASMGNNLLSVNLGAGFDAAQIELGVYYSCALSTAGAVKCWGNNVYATLGQGNTTTTSAVPLPVDVGPDLPVQIAAGSNHVCILTTTGIVKCWGQNTSGQLGIGNVNMIGDNASEMGALLQGVDLGVNTKAIKIAAGGSHTCALLSNHQIKCWGSNLSGQLGQDSTTGIGASPGQTGAMSPVNLGAGESAIDVVTGNEHTCALLASGNMKCWGSSVNGQLGYGNTSNQGNIVGSMSALPYINFGAGRKVIQMAAGQDVTCAVLDDGHGKCWGWNSNGISGQGDTANYMDPSLLPDLDLGTGNTINKLSVSLESACATLSNGRAKCWGFNNGRLGIGTTVSMGDNPGEMGDALPYVSLGTGTHFDVLKIASGDTHNCALMSNGLVKCWGNNADGQIGLNILNGSKGATAGDMGANLKFMELGGSKFVRDIVTGNYQSASTCAIMSNGELKCWGANYQGELGIGDVSQPFTKIGDEAGEVSPSLAAVAFPGGLKVRTAAMGPTHTCANTTNGEVYCFGGNSSGQLGLNNTASLYAPQATPVYLGQPAIQLALGSAHSCALLADGNLKCWGEGGSGALGQGSIANLGDSASEMNALVPISIDASAKVLKVSAGWSSTCALLDNHQVKCWGYNGSGVLGQNLADATTIGGLGQSVYSTGYVNFGSPSTAVDVQTNGKTTCVLKASGIVRCWGDNSFGMLGQNIDTPNIGTLTYSISGIIDSVLQTFIMPVGKITVGMNACVVSGQGKALCWGQNNFGRAGQETTVPEYGTSTNLVPGTAINL